MANNKVKIGINGFGRIGRSVFRAATESDDFEVVAVNDPFITIDYMTNLLENDSEHGRWKLPDLKVKDEKTIFYGDKAVTVTGIRSSEGIPWAESKSDYAVDTIGVSSDKDKDAAHSKDGDNKVIISALGKDVHLFVEGIRTTGNSITAAQRTVNGPSVDDWIVRRDASFNIIPTNIGTAKAVWKETEAELKEILGFRKDDLFMRSMEDNGSNIFDDIASIALDGKFGKITAWYDNEWGYSNRVLDLILKMSSHFSKDGSSVVGGAAGDDPSEKIKY